MTEKERHIKTKLAEDLLKMIPIIIESERERKTAEKEIARMIDMILDRVNQLRRELQQAN